jgi:choice-of-anchor B domain-containing protein
VGRIDGTAFVDITEPTRPVFVGDLPKTAASPASSWRDIKVYRNHAFIVADGAQAHGMQVFDLTRLRGVRNPPVTFSPDLTYDRIHSAHNIVIDTTSGFAFAVGASSGGETCGGALHMIDIRSPKSPTFAGCFADPTTGFRRTGYTHDAQCVVYEGPDAQYRGRQICFNSSEDAVGIADVTDKANPKAVSRASYPNAGYTHQGWLTDDHRYFYVDDEGDELAGTVPGTRTLIWDMQDLDDPVLLGEFVSPNPASDHNLYIKGNLMFQSNYASGLRVLDIADPKNPRIVGWFDTNAAGPDAPGFTGSWSNYPFFKSGTVVVTSIQEGVFLVRPVPRPLVP